MEDDYFNNMFDEVDMHENMDINASMDDISMQFGVNLKNDDCRNFFWNYKGN